MIRRRHIESNRDVGYDLPYDMGASLGQGMPALVNVGAWLLENGTDFFGLEDGSGRFALE